MANGQMSRRGLAGMGGEAGGDVGGHGGGRLDPQSTPFWTAEPSAYGGDLKD